MTDVAGVDHLAREVLQQYQPRYRKTPGLSGQVNDAPSYVDVEVVPGAVHVLSPKPGPHSVQGD